MAIALDTLAYARRLREAGFSEQQAEGQAAALGALMTDELASKQDLRELATQMNGRFETLERHVDTRLVELERRFEIRWSELEKRFEIRLDGRLADLEQRMTLRLGAMLVAAIAAAETLARLS